MREIQAQPSGRVADCDGPVLFPNDSFRPKVPGIRMYSVRQAPATAVVDSNRQADQVRIPYVNSQLLLAAPTIPGTVIKEELRRAPGTAILKHHAIKHGFDFSRTWLKIARRFVDLSLFDWLARGFNHVLPGDR